MTLGKKLRKLRIEKGFSTREVSEKLNLGKSTISNYENEARKPDYDMLRRLADFYGVTPSYLLDDEPREEKKVDFTSDELIDIMDEDLIRKFAEEKIKIIRFVQEVTKDEISLDDLRAAVEMIKQVRAKR